MDDPKSHWTQDDRATSDGDPASDREPLREFLSRHGWLVRGAILVLGLVVFELTANAAISTAVSCLEFGRTDFQTAWWLLRTDPDQMRGSVCSRCYLAWAFWWVAVVALIVISMILILGILINELGMGPVAPPAHLAGAFGLLAFSLALASGLSFVVVLAAFLNRTRIWLGPEPRWAKEQGVWPPSAVHRDRLATNQAKVIAYLACFFVMFPTLLVTTFVCFLTPFRDVPWAYLAIVALILGTSIVVISLVKRRILARSPGDCWPVDEPVIASYF